jgi:hypothetical protein
VRGRKEETKEVGKTDYSVGFQVFTAVLIFRDITPRLATLFHDAVLLGLFDPENGGHMFP